MFNDQPPKAARSAAVCNSVVPYILVCVGIALILLLESVGIRVLLGVAVLCLVAWAIARHVMRPSLKLRMMSALEQQDDRFEVVPNEKFSSSGALIVDTPHDFALTFRTGLARAKVLDCLEELFKNDARSDVIRKENVIARDGYKIDLVVYPDPRATTVYHVSVQARSARPGIVRVRTRKAA